MRINASCTTGLSPSRNAWRISSTVTPAAESGELCSSNYGIKPGSWSSASSPICRIRRISLRRSSTMPHPLKSSPTNKLHCAHPFITNLADICIVLSVISTKFSYFCTGTTQLRIRRICLWITRPVSVIRPDPPHNGSSQGSTFSNTA